mgnify:CR=1 FL=1
MSTAATFFQLFAVDRLWRLDTLNDAIRAFTSLDQCTAAQKCVLPSSVTGSSYYVFSADDCANVLSKLDSAQQQSLIDRINNPVFFVNSTSLAQVDPSVCSPSQSTGPTLPLEIIIGAAGGFLLLVIALIVIIMYRRHLKSQQQMRAQQEAMLEAGDLAAKQLQKEQAHHPATDAHTTVAAPLATGAVRSRLTRFYQKYNPAKLTDVDKTLSHLTTEDDVNHLFSQLVLKYGAEPEGTEHATAESVDSGATAQPAKADDLEIQ